MKKFIFIEIWKPKLLRPPFIVGAEVNLTPIFVQVVITRASALSLLHSFKMAMDLVTFVLLQNF
jgi:hypothetical protein